jgi:hypothetical protein
VLVELHAGDPEQGEMRMAKISLAGFKDPVRRPRYIIWTGVAVLVLAAVMIVALGVTSTRWFCAEGCHKVQDDTILAYEASTHSQISCMACHMPVNANPVIFILHKAEALGELYLTVRDDFELPLNAESHVALTMAETQCTQCHNMANRQVTPTEGVKIDHAVHSEVNAACPVCHNRVAHIENFELTLTDPQTGEPNTKHVEFMSMTACFRCHGLEAAAAAPGRCSACHPADFDLKPENHDEEDFLPAAHAEMALEAKAESEKAIAEAEHGEGEAASDEGSAEGSEEGTEGAEGSEAPAGEGEESEHSLITPEKAYASSGAEVEQVSLEEVPALIEEQRAEGEEHHESIGASLPTVESIFYCATCHTEQFCTNCHGMDMPHPASFLKPASAGAEDGHPAVSAEKAEKCVQCHGENEKTHFCDSCHHGEEAGGWEYAKDVPWTQKQHPQAVAAGGVDACTEQCHETKFCADCHTKNRVFPASHRQRNWTKPKPPGAMTVYGKEPAKVTAKHSLDAQKSIESCEVCHGSGGVNAKFCKDCHKLEMPHPAQFKENHVSGKKNPGVCSNCHLFREVCSNCHHVGSSLTRPWIQVHGASTNNNGTAGCVETCHTKEDCVKCHTSRDVVPASHRRAKFVRDFSNKDAIHVQLFGSDGETCTFCHAGQAAELPNSKFCKGCHKLEMPHPIDEGNDQKFVHQEGFQKKQLTKPQCSNCHQTRFCDACHHEGSVSNRPWLRYHPNIVGKEGAEPCFDCHQPTFCANCHVNLAKRGLLN